MSNLKTRKWSTIQARRAHRTCVYGEAAMSTALVYHPFYLEHYQPGHPESPERLKAIMATLDASPLKQRLTPIDPKPVSLNRLERVHTPEYVTRVRKLAESGGDAWRGGETYICPRSYDA